MNGLVWIESFVFMENYFKKIARKDITKCYILRLNYNLKF